MDDTQGNASGADPFASAAKLKPGTKRPLPPRMAAAIRGASAASDHTQATADPFSPRKRLKRTPPKGTPPVLDTAGHGSAGTATGPRVLNFAAMTSSATNHQQEQQHDDPSMSPPSSPATNSNSSPTRRPRPAASKPAASSSSSGLRPPFHAPARQPLLHRTPAGKPAAGATPHPAPRTSTPSRSLATPARPLPATPLTTHHAHARQGQAFTPATGRPGAAFAALDGISAGASSALAGGQAALSFTPRRQTLHQPQGARKNIVPAQRRLTYLAPPDARAQHAPAPAPAPAAAAAAPKAPGIGIHRHLRLESMPGGQTQIVDCGPVTAKVAFAHAGESREDGESVPDYVLDFGRSVVFGEFEGCT